MLRGMNEAERARLVQRSLVFAAQYERMGMGLSAQAERQFIDCLKELGPLRD